MRSVRTYLRREPSVPAAWAVLLVIVLIWLAGSSVSVLSVTIMIGQKVPLVLASIGAAIVIMSRGIDLSVGAVLTVVNTIIAAGTAAFGNSLAWIGVGLAVALVAGLVNGLCVAWLRLPPLIVTLAVQSILLGVALYVLPTPGGAVDAWLKDLTLVLVGPFPLMLLIVVAAPLLIWYPLRRSRFGTALLSSGADESAAYASGINVRRTVVSSYVLSALFAGLAGIVMSMNTGSGDPTIGVPFTMNTIAAAVVGGVSLAGGRGTIAGPIAGALVVSFIGNLLFSMGVNSYWQYVVTGAVLIVAIAIPAGLRAIRAGRQPS
jgi:ribose transport system permease protein